MSLIDTTDHISVFPFPVEAENKSSNQNPVLSKTFEVYPKIAKDYFIIEYVLADKENTEDVAITVFDNAGKEVKDFDVNTKANQFLIECENWEAGTYWCRKFINNKITEEEKVVICRGETVSGNCDKALAVNNLESEKTLKIYPNPAKDYFFINYNLKEIEGKDILMKITDIKGSIMKEIILEKSTTQNKISTSTWKKGVYTVSIISGSEVIDNVTVVVE